MVSCHVFSSKNLVDWTDYGVVFHLGSALWAAGTNHGSVIEYRGRWLAFHHSAWITGHGACRNLMCDCLESSPDGTIKPIVPTQEGVALDGAKPGPFLVTMRLEAENGAASLGELWGTTVATERAGYAGDGYGTGLQSTFAGITVMARPPARRSTD
jgi:hypothetical protein